MKVTGVIIGNFVENPYKVPDFCFVGVGPNNFLPLRGKKSGD